ncbi:hypothetical protein [Paenibacillus paeoniae]|uniref:hypothetical protein n=1 Tax=Paenibacillus paeoniae TaxID=2292705 RepID=UPI001058A3C4|nr:hypothetical protein [Paenibacillus paeoniae]
MAPEDRSLTAHVINYLAYRGKFTAEHVHDERFSDLIRHALHNRERGTYVLQAVDDKGMALDVWGHVYEDDPLPPVACWRLRIFHNLHPSQGDWFGDVLLAATHNLAYVVGVVSPLRRKSLGA